MSNISTSAVPYSKKDLIHSLYDVTASVLKLYWATHSVHWNITGPIFYEVHKLLQKQYEEIWESLDNFSEKIRQLDAYAPYDLEKVLSLGVNFAPIKPSDSIIMVNTLLVYQDRFLFQLNEAFKVAIKVDQGVANYIAGRIEAHNKMRWMLRATVKPTEADKILEKTES